MTVTLEAIKSSPVVQCYMQIGNKFLGNIGAIEHNLHHAELTARLCAQVLESLGFPPREAELGAIAGYLHDIGNLVNRYGHGMSGALMAFQILLEMDMNPEEISIIMGAIGNHEEHAQGHSVNNVAAALILADKSDVNRSRVRKRDFATFTARDRVNYAVSDSQLLVAADTKTITMQIQIDTEVCSVMEYFEIFLTKMLMSRRAAEFLGCQFELLVNNNRLL
ncbi:MAG TPA: HD domain-containing protein [Syntrophomonadaceae bacterium]|nr:HD domain-containing protein [Syntrophomonadaceae bacterium]